MNKLVLAASLPLVLLLSPPAVLADVCAAEGEVVLTDPEDDAGFQNVIPVPAPAGDIYDLLSLNVAATPLVKDEDRKLTFAIALVTQQPTPFMLPGTAIFASFVDSKQQVRGVRVQSDNSGGMSFFSYIAGPSSGAGGSPVTDGRFVQAGTEVPAQPESSYANGVATIVVKFKDVRIKEDGDFILGFNAATTQAASVSGVGGAAGTMDTMPEDLVHTNGLEIPKCGKKSADTKDAEGSVSDKSGTHFGGAFGLLNLLLMLPMTWLRRAGRPSAAKRPDAAL